MIDALGVKMYKPAEAMKIMGIGKNRMYEYLKDRVVEHIKHGNRIMIAEHHIKDALDRLTVRRSTPKLYPKG